MVGIIMGELGLPFLAFSRGLSTKIDEETVSPHRRTSCWVHGNLPQQQGSAVNYCQPPIIHLPLTAHWLLLRHVVLPIVGNPSGLDSSYNRWSLGGADQGDFMGNWSVVP